MLNYLDDESVQCLADMKKQLANQATDLSGKTGPPAPRMVQRMGTPLLLLESIPDNCTKVKALKLRCSHTQTEKKRWQVKYLSEDVEFALTVNGVELNLKADDKTNDIKKAIREALGVDDPYDPVAPEDLTDGQKELLSADCCVAGCSLFLDGVTSVVSESDDIEIHCVFWFPKCGEHYEVDAFAACLLEEPSSDPYAEPVPVLGLTKGDVVFGNPVYHCGFAVSPKGIGGKGGSVKFEIIRVSNFLGLNGAGCDYVVVRILQRSPNTEGVQVDDEVRVFDPCFCYLNMPAELLIGATGWATSVVNPYLDSYGVIDGYDYDTYGTVDCLGQLPELREPCIWSINDLCCTEEYPIYSNPYL